MPLVLLTLLFCFVACCGSSGGGGGYTGGNAGRDDGCGGGGGGSFSVGTVISVTPGAQAGDGLISISCPATLSPSVEPTTLAPTFVGQTNAPTSAVPTLAPYAINNFVISLAAVTLKLVGSCYGVEIDIGLDPYNTELSYPTSSPTDGFYHALPFSSSVSNGFTTLSLGGSSQEFAVTEAAQTLSNLASYICPNDAFFASNLATWQCPITSSPTASPTKSPTTICHAVFGATGTTQTFVVPPVRFDLTHDPLDPNKSIHSNSSNP